MYINLCPYTIGIKNLSFDNLAALAVKNGFGGIDFIPDQFASMDHVEEAAGRMKELNLQWGLFPMPSDFLAVGEHEFSEGINRLGKILPLVKAAGCRRTYNHIWPGNDSRPYDENFKWHVNRLKVLADLLSEYDVTLGLEFIGPKTLRDSFKYPFIHTMEQTLELTASVSPSLGLAVDCFHLYTSGGTTEDILKLSGVPIVNVHANDASPGRRREEQLDLERQMPMASGIVDSPGILKALRNINYDGPIICEPFQPTVGRFHGMSDEEVAREVSEVMKKLFKRSAL
jgi:sugar phosphate isomerase/epimerase